MALKLIFITSAILIANVLLSERTTARPSKQDDTEIDMNSLNSEYSSNEIKGFLEESGENEDDDIELKRKVDDESEEAHDDDIDEFNEEIQETNEDKMEESREKHEEEIDESKEHDGEIEDNQEENHDKIDESQETHDDETRESEEKHEVEIEDSEEKQDDDEIKESGENRDYGKKEKKDDDKTSDEVEDSIYISGGGHSKRGWHEKIKKFFASLRDKF